MQFCIEYFSEHFYFRMIEAKQNDLQRRHFIFNETKNISNIKEIENVFQ